VKLGDGLEWLEYLPILGFAAKGVKHIGCFIRFYGFYLPNIL